MIYSISVTVRLAQLTEFFDISTRSLEICNDDVLTNQVKLRNVGPFFCRMQFLDSS